MLPKQKLRLIVTRTLQQDPAVRYCDSSTGQFENRQLIGDVLRTPTEALKALDMLTKSFRNCKS